MYVHGAQGSDPVGPIHVFKHYVTLSLPFMQKGSSSNHPEANDLVRVRRNTKPQGRDVAFEGPGILEVLN